VESFHAQVANSYAGLARLKGIGQWDSARPQANDLVARLNWLVTPGHRRYRFSHWFSSCMRCQLCRPFYRKSKPSGLTIHP